MGSRDLVIFFTMATMGVGGPPAAPGPARPSEPREGHHHSLEIAPGAEDNGEVRSPRMPAARVTTSPAPPPRHHGGPVPRSITDEDSGPMCHRDGRRQRHR